MSKKSLIKDLGKSLAKSFDLEFQNHKFRIKFLTESEEQAIFQIASTLDVDGIPYISKLANIQLAFSIVDIDGDALYTSEDNSSKEAVSKSRLAVVDDFESNWDSDILQFFINSIADRKREERSGFAKNIGLSEDEVRRFLDGANSTLDTFNDIRKEDPESVQAALEEEAADLNEAAEALRNPEV